MYCSLGSNKRRAACDECRNRKVKCSGGEPCYNCRNDLVSCTYSIQKATGRPRKRSRPLGEGFLYSQSSFISTPQVALSEDGFLDQQSSPGPLQLSRIETSPSSSCTTSEAVNLVTSAIPVTSPCTCLSVAYLATTKLQLPARNDLPSSLADLQSAQASAVTILKCSQCPKTMVTAMQNLYQLSTLLTSIVGRMQILLDQVDASAQTGNQQDMSMFSAFFPRHDCVMMNRHQFRLFFRKMVKETILGSQTDTDDSTLLGIVNQFEKRQNGWHEDPSMYEEQAKFFGKRSATERAQNCQFRVCYKLIELLRHCIATLEL